MSAPSVPRGRPAPVPAACHELLEVAHHGLAEAITAPTPAERYVAAHLAALRSAAAVLASRARPAGSRRGPRSVWVVLPEVAPELGEWAAFFAAGAAKRAAAEAGLSCAVTAREGDDLLRDAASFVCLVEATLGLPHQPSFPLVG